MTSSFCKKERAKRHNHDIKNLRNMKVCFYGAAINAIKLTKKVNGRDCVEKKNNVCEAGGLYLILLTLLLGILMLCLVL